jgi:hypothetical protein
MGQKLQPWPFKRTLSNLAGENIGCRFAAHYLMSFEGMGKSIQTNGAPIRRPTPRSSLDEFPAGYSSTRCSPAELVSASPAGIQHDAALAQVRAYFNEETMNKIASSIKTVLQT